MKSSRTLFFVALVTMSLGIGSAATASVVPTKKNCTVWKGSMVYKKVKHGSTYTFSDGNTEECNNGEWVLVKQSSSQKRSNSKPAKTVVQRWCEARANGMTSSWWGQNYSWKIWNQWSDGSKTVERMGSGYAKDLPNGC